MNSFSKLLDIQPKPVLEVPFLLSEMEYANQSFIESNTIQSSFSEIKDNHIIPVFIKDNEPVISHSEFISERNDAHCQRILSWRSHFKA